MKQTQQQPSSTVAEEMGPVEEVIKAFIDYLVDPLLPLKIPPAPPLLSNQLKVAKQMHAVVLLYNYYQRKRHAQTEYIDFTSFCKVAVTLKPVLAAYMTSMQGSTPTDSENLEKQLSVTEKAIQDACKISTSLDVSRDIPDVNEWEVSKVAVFLVDPSKENCALSINLLTDGVWSIFEKSIDHCVDNEDNSKNPNKKKRKRRQATGEPDLQQLAFSALKEARGIQQSHLTILERHVTYSLDKERTSACCFIMECQSTNQKFEFSVRDTIESLQGPLVEKINGNWTLTQLIEYYNVLPYAGILSSWFSRQFPVIGSELLDASILEKYCGDDVPEYGKLDSESADSSLSELVDVGRQSAENGLDNIVSHDCANDIIRGDGCEKRYVGDVESDKTYGDLNLVGSKSKNDNLAGSEIDVKPLGGQVLPEGNKEEAMDVNVMTCPNANANANAQEDGCGMRILGEDDKSNKSSKHKSDYHNGSIRENVKGGLDVESDKTNGDDYLAKTKSSESIVDYERENVKGMDVDSEILPQKTKEETTDDNNAKNRSTESTRVDYKQETETVDGMDVHLSATFSAADNEESTDADNDNFAKSKSKANGPETENGEGVLLSAEILPQKTKKDVNLFNGPQSDENVEGMDVDLTGTLSGSEIRKDVIGSNNVQSPGENPDDNVKMSSTLRVPEKTCTSLHSENYNNPASVSIISAIHGEEVTSFNSFQKPVKEVLDAAETSLTCKLKTDPPLVLCDTKVLQQESTALLVDHTQEASAALANAESNLKSDESLPKEKDFKLCISESQFQRNSGLLSIDEKSILEKGNLPNEIKAAIVDTDSVTSDESDLKVIAQKDLEHGTTDMKPHLVLAAKIPSNCGTICSSLHKDVSIPKTSIASFPLGKGSSDSLLTCPKGKDELLSTECVIDNRKRSRNHESRATTEYQNTEGTSVVHPTINPVESMHGARDNLLSVLALRETKPSEASLGFLLHKKNDLYHQLQEIQDQIALCDQHIQKISDGNRDSLVLKVDTMINCCLDFLKTATEVQCNTYNEAGGYGAIQLPRPETTASQRQVSDNSNLNICAQADQLMSSSNGNFYSRVGASEVDFKCTGEAGGRFFSPPEMESVAAAVISDAGEPEPENY